MAAGGARKVDLGGNTVLPGFIDAHTHPAMAGLDHLRMVDCDLRSIADILAALRKRAAQTAPGEWVLGFKYDDTKTSDDRPLTIADLDSAVPDHPVLGRTPRRPYCLGKFSCIESGESGRPHSRSSRRPI